MRDAWKTCAGLVSPVHMAPEFPGAAGSPCGLSLAAQSLLCVSEGLKAPRALVWKDSRLDFHCSCPPRLTLFPGRALPARVGWGPGPWANVSPPAQFFSLSSSLWCVGWFHPALGFASVVIYPLTRMTHGTRFYLFQEKIAEGTSALWSWEAVLGA